MTKLDCGYTVFHSSECSEGTDYEGFYFTNDSGDFYSYPYRTLERAIEAAKFWAELDKHLEEKANKK